MSARALDLKVSVAKLAGAAARASGRGGGTSLPGRLLMRMDPHAIAGLSGRLSGGSAVISATNGKTTTAAMAAAILTGAGRRVVHNTSGANMVGGIASALLDASRRGRVAGDLGLFEVDEFWLGDVLAELSPRVLVLANLFRDQLDRYGELDSIADRWADLVSAAPATTQLVLNADDPLVADLGRDRPDVTYFGVEDPGMGRDGLAHAADSTHCRRCGSPYRYESIYLGHLGRYTCPGCGATRPRPHVAATKIRLEGTRGVAFTLSAGGVSVPVRMGLPGLYNVYNALAATALTLRLGVSLEVAAAGLAGTRAAFGRGEQIDVDGVALTLLLVKNPAGANEVLATLALEGADIDLLGILNDQIADGRDVSWIWDADWEVLAPHVRVATCAGRRAAELALRLKYAGVDSERLTVIEDLDAALTHALEGARTHASETPRLFAVPTYTAMLALRERLSQRGHVNRFWAE
ncbi:MurT ligase domain-containing protein [Conexibacter sp. DBS9H8]|uniref:MurT ligase domain-containing protein n=1 Tax=Conexibacter sp. DBS9H8 TaxID=2937801 RepID=UPI00200E5900|nr:MurT ligase domain-containing protein [Conexibacter sp. DBS9H8]